MTVDEYSICGTENQNVPQVLFFYPNHREYPALLFRRKQKNIFCIHLASGSYDKGRNTMGSLKRKEQVISSMEQTAMHVSKVSILVNLLLSAGKLAAGILGSSGAMISDAIHSASDVFSTIIVMIGIKISGKGADREHPYGHERMECVAAILLAAVLAVTGFEIGTAGLDKIISGNYDTLRIPGISALAAAVISVAAKEWMYWYTRFYAKKINSSALMADAWHHRSDALSSIGAFIGILGARMGFPVLDPVASVVICLFILKAAYDIFKDAIDKMVDTACDPVIEEELRDFVLKQDGVLGIDLLRTRTFGSRIYVDVDIRADGSLPLRDAHLIADRVHDEIEKNFEQVKHIMVHVNPA